MNLGLAVCVSLPLDNHSQIHKPWNRLAEKASIFKEQDACLFLVDLLALLVGFVISIISIADKYHNRESLHSHRRPISQKD